MTPHQPPDQPTTAADPKEAFIRALPCWQADTIHQVAPLTGGITNHNYKVRCQSGDYVVRLGDDIPVHQIKRFNEVAASQAAHAAGLAPQIHFHDTGVLVMDYIDAQPLTPEQVRNPQQLPKIIALVKACHTQVAPQLRGASVIFWVFHVLRDYAATLRAGNSPYSAQLAEFHAIAETLEHTAGPFDIVYCHNDLLAANLLDDGKRLWLIDWEYAGFNTPLFDLGGLASNNEFDEALEREMLQQYFATPPTDELWRRYQAMKCASLLRETLWSMVSEIHSTIDFDYTLYSNENRLRFERCLAYFKQL